AGAGYDLRALRDERAGSPGGTRRGRAVQSRPRDGRSGVDLRRKQGHGRRSQGSYRGGRLHATAL
ncbi:MAG: Copper chaperone, partial [uncultured Rubrobacteraceae bacterium]